MDEFLSLQADASPPFSPDVESPPPEIAEHLTVEEIHKKYDDSYAKSLRIHRESIPLQIESEENMMERLGFVIGRICDAVAARDWSAIAGWDGVYQCWSMLQYPLPRTLRAKLADLLYALVCTPGIEARIAHGYATSLSNLLERKRLAIEDWQPDWRPLWALIRREYKVEGRADTSNAANMFLHTAQRINRFIPASEIPALLETFLPLINLTDPNTYLLYLPPLLAFLPRHPPTPYLKPLLILWESLNSSIMDERMLDLMAQLSVRHMEPDERGEGGDWLALRGGKEGVGMWDEEIWKRTMVKCLRALNVPLAGVQSASQTSAHADVQASPQAQRLLRAPTPIQTLCKIIIYSMAPDGPVKGIEDGRVVTGYLGGCKALDSLDRLLTSTESFFHPSNSGVWTLELTLFLQRMTYEFIRRIKEEERPYCRTPRDRRLTPLIRLSFVRSLKTVALLAMFSKDPVSILCAQSALKNLALLEPHEIMPEILERAYEGLETVNETHRTTAVMSATAVVALPLVTDSIWKGGAKHIVPLLELCLPGIDLNDPIKTMCTSLTVVAICQHIRISDLSQVDIDAELSEEEREVRIGTAGFADWLCSYVRRVFVLLENLPEEGGKNNRTGGKTEESVLRSVQASCDVVFGHLDSELFDLVLNMIFDYASTTVRSNAVRAVGHLVTSLAKADSVKTVRKFWPLSSMRVREELENGASSTRSTSSHAAVPSDTSLHWHLSILRGLFQYSNPQMLKFKDEIIDLLSFMIEKSKSERGYTYGGRILTKVCSTLSTIYPTEYHPVNRDEWQSEEFAKRHNLGWGKMYLAEDIKVDWHVPSEAEISFILEILERILQPLLEKIEGLLADEVPKDAIWRNDLVRYMNAVRATWAGLGSLYQEKRKDGPPGIDFLDQDVETPELTLDCPQVAAGFVLTDEQDPRYRTVVAARTRYGELLHRTAVTLRSAGSEDHIDAVNLVVRAIDIYMTDYGIQRSSYDSELKRYNTTREMSRVWPRQKAFPRHVWIRRAYLHLLARKYQHSMYRRRSALDDQLIDDITEFSLSPYTRVRRSGQSVQMNIITTYTRSTRFVLPKLFDALVRGTDPDRMKGALYVLWNKAITSYVVSDWRYQGKYLLSVLDSSWQEKPSIQKLIASITNEIILVMQEEMSTSVLFIIDHPGLDSKAQQLRQTYPTAPQEDALHSVILSRLRTRVSRKDAAYDDLLDRILQIARSSATHWRYVQMSIRFLKCLIRRDRPAHSGLAELLISNVCSENPTTRRTSQLALEKMLLHVEIRTFSSSPEEMFLETGRNPLKVKVPRPDLQVFSNKELASRGPMFDKLQTGWLICTPTVDAYALPPATESAAHWDEQSQPTLDLLLKSMNRAWFQKLVDLYAQESSGSGTDIRNENVRFIKRFFKIFEDAHLDNLISSIEPLLEDKDRFKQRAAAEFLSGAVRTTKYWRRTADTKFWSWLSPRLQTIFRQVTPDTVNYWESFLSLATSERDPRRCQALDFVRERGLNVDFNGESAFSISNAVAAVGILLSSFGERYEMHAEQFLNLYWRSLASDYAEVRSQVAHNIDQLLNIQWHPSYTSVEAFIEACEVSDFAALKSVNDLQMSRVQELASQLPTLKESRLPGPKVNQSEYDKVGLTALRWIWIRAHSSSAPSIYPYMQPLMPEALRMSELMDSSELRAYAIGLLYVLAAVTPSLQYVEPVMDALIEAVRTSPSWRIRLQVLPIMQVFYFRQLPLVSEDCVLRIMDVLVECLRDESIEVRQMASKTLSGVLRCSQRHSILALKDRFVGIVQKTRLPSRSSEDYTEALRSLHAGVLGLTALIDAYPYTVPNWLPPLLPILADHSSQQPPISSTIRKCAADFRRTHQDTWHTDQNMFDEEQLAALSTIVTGTSYYA